MSNVDAYRKKKEPHDSEWKSYSLLIESMTQGIQFARDAPALQRVH